LPGVAFGSNRPRIPALDHWNLPAWGWTITDFLEERRAELERRAREREVDWDALSANLPEDPRARVAALATVLGFDALRAWREDVSLEQLEQERLARREAAEQGAREAEEAGVPLPEGEGAG
jgi:hypothetical protein